MQASLTSSFGYKPQYSQLKNVGLASGPDTAVVNVVTVTGAVTLTAAQVMGGMVAHAAGAGANLATPTAAEIVAALGGASVGTAVRLHIRNTGAGASTLTAGAGVTLSGTAATATLNAKTWLFVVTNNIIGSEAVTAYSLGSSVF